MRQKELASLLGSKEPTVVRLLEYASKLKLAGKHAGAFATEEAFEPLFVIVKTENRQLRNSFRERTLLTK